MRLFDSVTICGYNNNVLLWPLSYIILVNSLCLQEYVFVYVCIRYYWLRLVGLRVSGPLVSYDYDAKGTEVDLGFGFVILNESKL